MSEVRAVVRALEVANITPDPDQPRKLFRTDELRQLAESMDALGLMQPITVREVKRVGQVRQYVIIAGERRFRAAQSLGWEHIDGIVSNVDESMVLPLQAIENIARAEMTPIEEALAYQRMLVGRNNAEVERLLGLAPGMVVERLKLLELIPSVQTMIELGQIKVGTAKQLADLNEENQRRVLGRMARTEMTHDEVKALCDALLARQLQSDMGDTLPEAKPVSEETQRRTRDYEGKIDRAVEALALLAGVDDEQLMTALSWNLPGLSTKTSQLRKEARRLELRLQRLAAFVIAEQGEEQAS